MVDGFEAVGGLEVPARTVSSCPALGKQKNIRLFLAEIEPEEASIAWQLATDFSRSFRPNLDLFNHPHFRDRMKRVHILHEANRQGSHDLHFDPRFSKLMRPKEPSARNSQVSSGVVRSFLEELGSSFKTSRVSLRSREGSNKSVRVGHLFQNSLLPALTMQPRIIHQDQARRCFSHNWYTCDHVWAITAMCNLRVATEPPGGEISRTSLK
jgi:hypothetical protein